MYIDSRTGFLFMAMVFLNLGCFQSKPPDWVEKKEFEKTVSIDDVAFFIRQDVLNYTMDTSGKYFFVYDGSKIYRYSIELENIENHIKFELSKGRVFNLIHSKDKIGMLVFDKKTQYDTSVEKIVKLYEFDTSLNLLDSSYFYTPRLYHLLSEDFGYVSYFHDTEKNKYYFNHYFSYLQETENGKWVVKRMSRKSVDIDNGVIYEIDLGGVSGGSVDVIFHREGERYSKKEMTLPQQLSIFNSIVATRDKKTLYVINMKTDSIKRLQNSSNMDPSNRFNGGIYQVVGDSLKILYL